MQYCIKKSLTVKKKPITAPAIFPESVIAPMTPEQKP